MVVSLYKVFIFFLDGSFFLRFVFFECMNCFIMSISFCVFILGCNFVVYSFFFDVWLLGVIFMMISGSCISCFIVLEFIYLIFGKCLIKVVFSLIIL